MTSVRKTALVAGAFYLLSFVSIPTLFLYIPVHDPSYVVGPGPDTGVLVGCVLEIIVALAGIGTAVALYPVVKRQNEGVALGFVGSRILEGAGMLAGAACLLSIVSLRPAGAGTGALDVGDPVCHAVFSSLWERASTAATLTALSVAVFDFSLGVWLLVKGFGARSPILSGDTRDAGVNWSLAPAAGDRRFLLHPAQGRVW